ncbi:MAG TPA: hypothetical protein DIC60_07640 [Lachnospiraceae bacterium]|nr:hypothetical protein [Lachnospiraceae bacterium]
MGSRSCNNKCVRHKLKNSVYLKSAMAQSKRNLKLECDLAETKDRLSSLIDTVPGGIVILRIAKTVEFIFFNDAACALVGFSRAEYNSIVKNNAMALVYEEDRENFEREIQNAVKQNRHIDFVYRVNHKLGHHPWVHLFAIKYKQDGGVPIFHAVFLDITKEIQDKKEIEAANQKLLYRADYDVLTGIYNRQAFCRETAKMLSNNIDKKYVLLCLDVERFKVINDLFGTEMGDKVLQEIALDFRKNLRGLGTYGRLEADHFVCCFPEAIFNVDIILKRIDRFINRIDISYAMEVDFGIYAVDDILLPIDRMCDRANLALRTIKGNYLKKYAFYDEELRNIILKEQQITNEMDFALKNGQFKIHLQPIYNVANEKPVSAEALVRWYHPERGLISPGDFIPLFERNGFISKLDAYVWEEVCKFIHSQKEKGHSVVPISVNVSRINLYNTNICNEIISLTEKYDIEPEMLKFEITESAYTDNLYQLLNAMETLQKHGFEILMDDFGSGYSSLNMLKDVPVDILKIDMKFIEDLDVSSRAGSVMTNVIRMAKWLNMSVVAEGVETKAQLVVLRNIGCDKVQGFYLSKPLSTGDFAKLMEDQNPENAEKMCKLKEVDIDCVWEADQKFAHFINGMIDGMGIYEVVDNGLEIIRANDGYFHIMGGTSKDLFSKKNNVLEHVFPEDRDNLMRASVIAVEKKCVQEVDIRRIRQNNEFIWVNVRISYLGKFGANDAFYFAINNISYQKKLENDAYLRQCSDAFNNSCNEVMLLDYTDNCIVPISRSNVNSFQILYDDALDVAVHMYSENVVHSQDKNKFLQFYDKEKIEQVLVCEGKTNIETEIRIKTKNGDFQWVLIKTVKIEDPFGKITFLSCIKNIDKEKKTEFELENIKEMLENIIPNMPVGFGIYQINDQVIPLYLNDEGCKLLGFSREEYNFCIANRQPIDFNFGIAIDTPEMEELRASNKPLKKVIKVYKKNKTPITLYVVGTYKKNIDGKVLFYALFFDEEEFFVTQNEIQKAEHYDLHHCIINKPEKRTILIVDDSAVNRSILKKILADTYNVLESENSACALELLNREKTSVAAVLLDIIKPAKDGYSLLNAVRCDATLTSIPIIVITGEENEDKDAETKAVSLGAKELLARPFEPTVVRQRIANQIKLKDTTVSKNSVEKIINNLPGVVCVFEISDKIRTRYISEGLSNICGYSVEEYISIFGEDFIKIVGSKDIQRVTESVYKSKNSHEPIDVEYTINCRNGDMGYSRIQANFAYEEDGLAVYYGVITEMTAKEIETRQRYEFESAFRLSLTGDSCVFFECDIVTGKIISVDEGTTKFVQKYNDENCFDILEKAVAKIIHPEDKELFDKIINTDMAIENILNGKNETYLEYRYSSLLGKFEGYRWANTMLSYIINPKTQHPHVFICIRDIHEQKLKYLEIMDKAQRDFLTGLFNRAAFQELAQKAIDECKENGSISAFLIIDIDNFKKINDTFGHVHGDVVLKHTAKRLETVFRSNDILGRLGGDEMVVFMANIPSADIAVKKGFEVCRLLGSWRKNDKKTPLTCSVGVAVMPEHGLSLEKLYHNADMALYQAKRIGKNICCLFDENTI